MTSNDNAHTLQSILAGHPAVNRAWTSDKVRAQLKGFGDTGCNPWVECDETDTPPVISVTVRGIAQVPPSRLVHFEASRINCHLCRGAVCIDPDDGEVSWRMSSPVAENLSAEEKAQLIGTLVSELLEQLPAVRETLLAAALAALGIPDDLRERVLTELEKRTPDKAPADKKGEAYGSFRDLLEGLRHLLESCALAQDSKASGHDNATDRLDETAQIEAEVMRRLDLTKGKLAPPNLRAIISIPSELRSRLLGFLAVQALLPINAGGPEHTSLRQLGAWVHRDSWPREALDARDVARDLVQVGLVVHGRAYETPTNSAEGLELDSVLRLSPSALESSLDFLKKDVLGDGDLNSLRRQLDSR